MALPKLQCTDDGHRKTHCCRDSTSFCSRPDHCCRRMNDSIPHETFACVSSLSLSLPCRSTNHVLLLSQLFSRRELSVFLTFSSSRFVRRALPHNSGAPQHRTFPLLNLHRTRVRRNHGQPRSNGFIERARNTLPDFTAQSQRASDKALTFLRTWQFSYQSQLGLLKRLLGLTRPEIN